MEIYKFPETVEKTLRKSPIPLAVYRLAAKKLDTIAVSEGLLKQNSCRAAAAPNCRVFCTAGRCLLKS